MGKYIDQGVLERALTPQTVVALFTDGNTGEVNVEAVGDVIDYAEAEVDSYLIGYAGTYPFGEPTDRLLRAAAVNFAISFSFRRNPEYVRQFGDMNRADNQYQMAKGLMLRIQAVTQKLPDQPAAATAPLNGGGIVVSGGPRLMVASADGTQNGDGF